MKLLQELFGILLLILVMLSVLWRKEEFLPQFIFVLLRNQKWHDSWLHQPWHTCLMGGIHFIPVTDMTHVHNSHSLSLSASFRQACYFFFLSLLVFSSFLTSWFFLLMKYSVYVGLFLYQKTRFGLGIASYRYKSQFTAPMHRYYGYFFFSFYLLSGYWRNLS